MHAVSLSLRVDNDLVRICLIIIDTLNKCGPLILILELENLQCIITWYIYQNQNHKADYYGASIPVVIKQSEILCNLHSRVKVLNWINKNTFLHLNISAAPDALSNSLIS